MKHIEESMKPESPPLMPEEKIDYKISIFEGLQRSIYVSVALAYLQKEFSVRMITVAIYFQNMLIN